MRIAFFGRSGAGKTTAAALLAGWCDAVGISSQRVTLADPLYRLQREVYGVAGHPVSADAQDQLLLEDLARHLRRINPGALVEDFLHRLGEARAQVIVNTDLRDPHVDAPALRAEGFRLVRIHCEDRLRLARQAARGDLTTHPDEPSASGIDEIRPDATVDNSGTRDQLRQQVEHLMAPLRAGGS